MKKYFSFVNFGKTAACFWLRQSMFLNLAILLPLAAWSQNSPNKPVQLTPELFLQIQQIGDFHFSTDGTRLAMTVTEPVKEDSRNSDIWIYETDTQDLFQFTASEKSDRHPRWSPDGSSLAFLSSRAKKTQIYQIFMRGGEAQAITESKTDIRSFEWAPDGKFIAFLAQEPEKEEESKRKKEKDDAYVVDKDDKLARLWWLDIQSRKVHQLTYGDWRISEFLWQNTSAGLIVVATNNLQPELLTNRIYSLSLTDSSFHEIAHPPQPFHNVQLSPDGKTLSFLGVDSDGPEAHDLFVLKLDGNHWKNLTGKNIDRSISNYYWRNNQQLLAVAATGFTNTFYEVQVSGDVSDFGSLPDQTINSFAVNDKHLAYVGQTAIQPPEFYLMNEKKAIRKISSFNVRWDSVTVLKPEIFTYSGFDGVAIEAALLKPTNFQEGKNVPLVALIHGGPSGRWSNRLHSWGQLLAQHGIAVFYPNIRGSVGYGYQFLTDNHRDWGGDDYRDVMAGIEYLVETGIADSSKLGIGGWSYGGYMAAWAVTQTDRFKVSVSGAPMTDLATEYGTEASSINAYDTWYMGTPYENLELFSERSPVTFVKNVSTPTLLLCGEQDRTDPLGQCQQFYRGLKRYGVETELVVYPREGHGIREEKHQLDVLNRITDWFLKYLKE